MPEPLPDQIEKVLRSVTMHPSNRFSKPALELLDQVKEDALVHYVALASEASQRDQYVTRGAAGEGNAAASSILHCSASSIALLSIERKIRAD